MLAGAGAGAGVGALVTTGARVAGRGTVVRCLAHGAVGAEVAVFPGIV